MKALSSQPRHRMTTSATVSKISLNKNNSRSTQSSKNPNEFNYLQQVTETEKAIQLLVDHEKAERIKFVKQQKKFEDIMCKLKLQKEMQEQRLREEFEDYKVSQSAVIRTMQTQINQLKQMLNQNNEVLNMLKASL